MANRWSSTWKQVYNLNLMMFLVDALAPAATAENHDASELRGVVIDLTTIFEMEMGAWFVETNNKV